MSAAEEVLPRNGMLNEETLLPDSEQRAQCIITCSLTINWPSVPVVSVTSVERRRNHVGESFLVCVPLFAIKYILW